jgi:hypothetical protein
MINAGEVNWMTAGSGIAHSERTPQQARASGTSLFGIQSWVALPKRFEETAPSFAHHPQDKLPVVEGEGKRVRLIAGSLYGSHSPVETLSEMFYADVKMERGAHLPVPTEHEERAAYVVEGAVQLSGEGESYEAGRLLVFKPRAEVTLETAGSSGARVMLLGGEPMDDRRHIWWNFVSSSEERIEQAKEDWKAGRFASVPDETEFIPLPESGPVVVRYP